MRTKPLSKLLIILLVVNFLFSDVAVMLPAGGVEPVQAAAPGSNVILGFFRALSALGRRNRVYREAGATSAEINAYYDALIAQAGETRRAMITKAAAGEKVSPLMARAYVRIEAALQAERKAAIRMIEQEKNQARKDFERTLVKEITNILIASPGGQRLIRQVRDTIGNTREAAVAVQVAIEGGKPIEALQEALVEKVGDFPLAQAAARKVGSVVGHGLDRALGGALSKIEKIANDIQGEMGAAIEVLDTLDTEVARHDGRERQPVSLVEDNSLIGKIVPVNRVNPVVDVVASAWAGGAKIAGNLEPGESRDTMRDRIRGALLDDRVQGIQAAKSGTAAGTQYCTSVGRGPYEVAALQLGQTPQIPADVERAVYMVCYDIQLQVPILAKMFGGDKKEEGEMAEDETPTPPPAVIGEQIPVGTYIGTSDYPQVLEKVFSPGQFSTNEVIIHVAEDGTVSGSLSVYYIGDTFIREDNGCVKHWETDVQGEFHGQLFGNHGTIGLTENWVCVLYADCTDTGSCDDEPLTQQIDVQVSGDQMSGITRLHPEDPDGIFIWTLTAKKE